MAEGARLESVFRGDSNAGSNPAPSAIKKARSLSGLFWFWMVRPLDDFSDSNQEVINHGAERLRLFRKFCRRRIDLGSAFACFL